MKMTLNVLRNKGREAKAKVYKGVDVALTEAGIAYAFEEDRPGVYCRCIAQMDRCAVQIHAVNIVITGMETLDGGKTYHLQVWNCTIPENIS